MPRQAKQLVAAKKETLLNCKRMASWCQREIRKQTLVYEKQFCQSQYNCARRLCKEMLVYWKHFERVEKDYRKRAEKEAQEQLRLDIELLEAKRQQRKLNFLITQTELYAHFMSKKQKDVNVESTQHILDNLNEDEDDEKKSTSFELGDEYNVSGLKLSGYVILEWLVQVEAEKQKAFANAESVYKTLQTTKQAFDDDLECKVGVDETVEELPQPKMFDGCLKSYQMHGVTWLYSLFQNGINGILADEMGLGKTIQTIAFLATLAERQNIWGPYLIVAPVSTLHNWQQEFSRFAPSFKVLPYWGNPNERKVSSSLQFRHQCTKQLALYCSCYANLGAKSTLAVKKVHSMCWLLRIS